MQMQTKNIITREWVEKELRFYNSAHIKSSVVLFIVVTLIFAPATVAMVYGIDVTFDNTVFKILLSAFVIPILIAPMCIWFVYIVKGLRDKRMLACGSFEIVVADLSYKAEEYIHRRLEEKLYFPGFNKLTVGHTAYQLASAGDSYYLVCYKGRKKIELFYPQKLYELR